jgi:ion channel-forming bestrophin family protein
MYLNRKIPFRIIWAFGWYNLIIFISISLGAVLLFKFVCSHWIAIPFLPVSLFGTSTIFYIGFKNNSSYDRLWEARRIWGSIVNDSRSWAFFVRDMVGNQFTTDLLPHGELQKGRVPLIKRRIAYMHALRVQMRKPQPWEHNAAYNTSFREAFLTHFGPSALKESFQPFLDENELERTTSAQNPALAILSLQSRDLENLRSVNAMDDFRHVELQKIVQRFSNNQGASERIKNFPFPHQYTLFSNVFVWIFVCLLPFSLLKSFSEVSPDFIWMVIPFSVLASWFLLTMELVGDYSENPFEFLINDVPLSTMCRNVEIDLPDILQENKIPERFKPINGIQL